MRFGCRSFVNGDYYNVVFTVDAGIDSYKTCRKNELVSGNSNDT